MLLWTWTTLSPKRFVLSFIFGDPDTALRCIVTTIIVYTLAGWICIDGVEVDCAFPLQFLRKRIHCRRL